MQSTPKHSLAGKARRVRDITRSHRLHSQQLIGEYLDWESGEEEPERHIPIRRNGQLLPSAEFVQSSSSDDSGAGQFEFVHTPSGAIVDTAAVASQHAAVASSLAPVAEVKPAGVAPNPAPAKLAPKFSTIPIAEKPAVIRPARMRTSALPFAEPAPPLSPRGLLMGCAIGTVGAGVLLAIASLFFG